MTGRERIGSGGDSRRAARARPTIARVAGHTLGLLAATLMASITLWPVYQSREFIVVVPAAFALGAVIAISGARFRWPAWTVILVSTAGFLLVGVPLAIPGQAVNGIWPSAAGLLDLTRASALSWKQLVTIVLPVGSYQGLLVPALILVLGSTVVGLSVALRTRRPELAVLAPTAYFICAIVLGSAAEFSPALTGLGYFAAALGWLIWMRRTRRSVHQRHAPAGTVLSVLGIMVVAVSIGTVAAIAVPVTAERDVLRSRVQQPFDPQNYASPLSEFRSYLQPARADETLFEVEGLPAGGRLRLATLDSYDGIVYSVGSPQTSSRSGAFTRLPYRLDQSGVAGQSTALTVTVAGYSGVWVPGSGQLQQISFSGATAEARSDSFYYNDNGGSAAVVSGLQRGDRYRSESITPFTVPDLSTLRPGSAVLPPIGLVPDGLPQALDAAVGADDVPGVQLQAMLDQLAAAGYVSHGVSADEPLSRSGHGADRITQLFTDLPMLGDQEQYAVAAALMARQIGFPARVVVGFEPQTSGPASIRVTGADASAWIEVQSSTGAWVAIDPTPPARDIPANEPDDPTAVSRPQSVLPPPVIDTPQQRDPLPAERVQEDPIVPVNPFLAFLLAAAPIVGWSLLALLLVLSPFLFIIAAKVRRRRLRRSRVTPLARVSGAWTEFTDAVADSGLQVPRSTRREFAGVAGGASAFVLAEAVDRAIFAPETTSMTEADSVWRVVDEVRGSLMVGKTRRQRLRALISIRTFSRYAGLRVMKEDTGS